MRPAISFTSPVARCEYLPDRLRQLRYELAPDLRPEEFMVRLQQGWRRFGDAMFRPECPSCTMCLSLRVPVSGFRPDESQRRTWKRNRDDVTIRIGTPSHSPAKLDLFERFHRFGQERKGWPGKAREDAAMFVDNPFPTEEWCYYVADRLVAVGYVDALPEGLSAIYFGYEPDERRRSLGTFNVLSLITAARQRRVSHVYLGYFVQGCRSMEYKAKFRPNEVLRGGTWQPFGK